MGDPRFRHAMPTTVRGHVLAMTTEANDAFGLSLLGLREHATAAALGPIRNIAETVAWAKWLLESPDDDVRQARAYRLTLNALDGYRSMRETLVRVAGQSAQAAELAPQLAAAEDRMRRSLAAMTDQDGITIPASPGRASRLIEHYLPEQVATCSMPCSIALGHILVPPGATCSTDGPERESLTTTSRACTTCARTGSHEASA